MRLCEILLEYKFAAEKYGSYTIKFSEVPLGDGLYRSSIIHKSLPPTQFSGKSKEEVVAKAKEYLDGKTSAQGNVGNTGVNIDFNIEFTKEILDNHPTSARLVNDGGQVFLDVADPEWFEVAKEDLRAVGFRKIHPRKASDNEGTNFLYHISLTPDQTRKLNLKLNGRYAVIEQDSPDEYYRRFKLVLDSVTDSPKDKKRLHTPGFTVAAW